METICPVLIVDDDDDLCMVLAAVLKRLCPVHVEHTLECAGSYLDGLHGRIALPAIVLLDNNLPDGTGVGYISRMRSMYPEVKVILMTADTSDGLKENALREGASYFISKPFRAATINDVILSICPDLKAA